MSPEELRQLINFLRRRVQLVACAPVMIRFDIPTEDEVEAAGLNREGFRKLLAAPWWGEMIAEVIGTPEFCEPDDGEEVVLRYAQDVIDEYIKKRYEP